MFILSDTDFQYMASYINCKPMQPQTMAIVANIDYSQLAIYICLYWRISLFENLNQDDITFIFTLFYTFFCIFQYYRLVAIIQIYIVNQLQYTPAIQLKRDTRGTRRGHANYIRMFLYLRVQAYTSVFTNYLHEKFNLHVHACAGCNKRDYHLYLYTLAIARPSYERSRLSMF